MDRDVWWAAVHGVAKSQTQWRIKQSTAQFNVYMPILLSQITPLPSPVSTGIFTLYLFKDLSTSKLQIWGMPLPISLQNLRW